MAALSTVNIVMNYQKGLTVMNHNITLLKHSTAQHSTAQHKE